MVAALIGIVEIICMGGLVVLSLVALAEVPEWRARHQKAALQQRLQAFHHAQRIRQAAAAKQAQFDLNMLAYQTAQTMLRVAIEADRKAAKTPAK